MWPLTPTGSLRLLQTGSTSSKKLDFVKHHETDRDRNQHWDLHKRFIDSKACEAVDSGKAGRTGEVQAGLADTAALALAARAWSSMDLLCSGTDVASQLPLSSR